jgi:Uma2 family endonuclease
MTQLLNRSTDQWIALSGTWEQFKLIQKGFEDNSGARLSYYEGRIEILMPGEDHELFSRIIFSLVMLFLVKKGIPFKPTGAKTQEKEQKASAQADESFCIGESKPIPDLSIEIIFSSGRNKLPKYQALRVPEVWFWEDGVLKLYRLREQGYESIERSELPGLDQLDIALLRRCILMAETDFAEAIRVFQQEI